ncbi:hypothetical protein M885DRAFT_343168 [Pelagophyceae sp. CCMP2097]|nr:hypothetical protein M885DRAFT_343168 [Pelagophyceae sp. CCMP2097]
MRRSLAWCLVAASAVVSDDACDLAEAGRDQYGALQVFANQDSYLDVALDRCLASSSEAADAVRGLRGRDCPTKWAVTCLDHFNCEDILADVSRPLAQALNACVAARRRGVGRRHAGWASATSTSAACPTASQKTKTARRGSTSSSTQTLWTPNGPRKYRRRRSSSTSSSSCVAWAPAAAAAAAASAASDADADVSRRGRAALAQQLRANATDGVLGVTVDDYRGFVALDDAARNYAWLDYSYRNVDVAAAHGHVCTFVKPISAPRGAAGVLRALRVGLDDGAARRAAVLHFCGDDSPETLHRRAADFVRRKRLTAGGGCDGEACLGHSLAEAMRRDVADARAANASFGDGATDTDSAGGLDVVHVGDGARRTAAIDALRGLGLNAASAVGLFGPQRAAVLRQARLGLNLHRHPARRIAEVVRLLTYAASRLPAVSESHVAAAGDGGDGGDALLEAELSSAVLFVPHARVVPCAAALLGGSPEAREALWRLSDNAARLAAIRSEEVLLAPTLAALFPACAARL